MSLVRLILRTKWKSKARLYLVSSINNKKILRNKEIALVHWDYLSSIRITHLPRQTPDLTSIRNLLRNKIELKY